jgi:mono/diheme cytochrome c family protein
MRFLAAIGVLAICVAIAGAVYFFGGFYNVAASEGGNPLIEWAVVSVREASLDRHFHAPPPPAWFSDPKTVAAGAHEFVEEGCVRCHGGPGVKPDKFAQGMEPKPPDLKEVGEDDEPAHIFWVIKTGIRMTGMPAFGGHAGDDEIWRAVAFIKHIKDVSPEDFKTWSAAGERGEAAKPEGATPAPGGAAPAK